MNHPYSRQWSVKKILAAVIVAALFVVAFLVSGSLQSCSASDWAPSSNQVTAASIEDTAQRALTTDPLPVISYFQERKTIKRFMQYYDRPGVVTYVYLFVFGTPVGYFVVDGKPASIQSYLTPEDKVSTSGTDGITTRQAQALDGTYGSDNPGLRFFTAGGMPIEFGGTGISYIYSPAPIDLQAPRLYRDKPEATK